MDADNQVTNSPKAIATFVAVVYAMSVALSLMVGLTGGYHSPFIGLQLLSMFIPAVAVLGVCPLMGGAVRIDWHRLPWTYVRVALLLLPVVMHAAMLPVAATYKGRLPWQEWPTRQADGLFHSSTERGWGVMTPTGLAGRMALNATVGVVVVSVMATFEEIGWRAWLLPRLQARMGARRAVSISSAVWAAWLIPFQLSGVEHVDGVSPVMLALTFPFGTFGAGLVIGWLWLKTESIWIVSLAHGALNNWGAIRLQVHAVRAGSGGGCQKCRVAGSSCRWGSSAQVWCDALRATGRRGVTSSFQPPNNGLPPAAVGGIMRPPRLKPRR